MTCNETGQTLDDGAIRIFLNTHGKNPEEISPELKELLYYMEHTTEESPCSTSRLQEIRNHVNVVKSSEEIGVKYMQEWEEKILEKRKARAEGLAEGRVEGLAEGRAEGMKLGITEGKELGITEGRAEGKIVSLIDIIKKKILKSKTLTQIADELEEDPENIQSLYECVSEHLQESSEDIYKHYTKLYNNKE